MTTNNQTQKTGPIQRLASTADIGAAMLAIGAGVALRSVMPWPVFKVVLGLAAVTAVAAVLGIAYRRHVGTEPAVEEMPAAEVESTS